MKTIKLLFIGLATMGSASAAIYTLQTGTGANINGFANSAGVAFQGANGSGYFGYFNVADSQVSSFGSSADLITSFQVFGGPNTFAIAGPIGQKGSVSVSGSNVVTGSEFAGKNIYFVVGNAATLGGANEYSILKTTFIFEAAQDAVPTPAVLTVTTDNSSVLFGGTIANLATTTTDSTTNVGFTTVAIPEPSAALLGAIGALGLLRRRRN